MEVEHANIAAGIKRMPALLHPAEVLEPNLVSYEKAKNFVNQGKQIKPSIEDFKVAYEQWGEMEFY